MTKQTEAMKLALEALNGATRYGAGGFEDAKDALREALAEQPTYRAVKTFHEGKPVYVAEQPAPPPECQTEAEKAAFTFGWFKALESVRQQPAQQEPVVFCMHWEDRWGCNHYADPKEPHPINSKPLYTSPPAQRTWAGLTDEEAEELWESTDSNDDWELMKRTEAKLRSKNT